MNYIKQFMKDNGLLMGMKFAIIGCQKYKEDRVIFYISKNYTLRSTTGEIVHNSIMVQLLTGEYKVGTKSFELEGGEIQMKMKAYDLMKLAKDNPQQYVGRSFKVVTKFAVDGAGTDIKEFIIDVHGGFVHQGMKVYVAYDTEVEETDLEVSFMEAMKAYDNGSVVYCVVKSGTVEHTFNYRPSDNQLKNDYRFYIRSAQFSPLTTKEIFEGRWFIKR